MILIGTANSFPTQQEWLDCIADWHQFCVEQGLQPWEHLTTEELGFYVSQELYKLRPVAQKAS
jgi:hypothetical protein